MRLLAACTRGTFRGGNGNCFAGSRFLPWWGRVPPHVHCTPVRRERGAVGTHELCCFGFCAFVPGRQGDGKGHSSFPAEREERLNQPESYPRSCPSQSLHKCRNAHQARSLFSPLCVSLSRACPRRALLLAERGRGSFLETGAKLVFLREPRLFGPRFLKTSRGIQSNPWDWGGARKNHTNEVFLSFRKGEGATPATSLPDNAV
jgi:hypothetical protein